MKELHLSKKDFHIDWFSGTGKGGQHRNKHQNCCRITHIQTGLRSQGTEGRDRPTNQRNAFKRLASLLVQHYSGDEGKERYTATETVRNYHGVRNEVHDKASGLKLPYKEVIQDIGPMIEARLTAVAGEE